MSAFVRMHCKTYCFRNQEHISSCKMFFKNVNQIRQDSTPPFVSTESPEVCKSNQSIKKGDHLTHLHDEFDFLLLLVFYWVTLFFLQETEQEEVQQSPNETRLVEIERFRTLKSDIDQLSRKLKSKSKISDDLANDKQLSNLIQETLSCARKAGRAQKSHEHR